MLKTLHLTNFQRHADLTIEFTPGLVLLAGGNWTGKSTVLRGILFSLFGGSAVPIKNELLVRRGEKSLGVDLVFEAGGRQYHVSRNKSGARLTDNDGAVLASGQTAVTEKVESLIGMSAQEFLTFNSTSQREAASLLGLGANKIGQHLASATGVDLVDKVLARARAAATEAKGAMGTWRSLDLAAGVAKWQVEERTRQDECDGLVNAKATLDSQLADATGALEQARAGLTGAEEQEREGREKLRYWGEMLRDLEVADAVLKQHLDEHPGERLDVSQAAVDAAGAEADAAAAGMQEFGHWSIRHAELETRISSAKEAVSQYDAWLAATARPVQHDLDAAAEKANHFVREQANASMRIRELEDMLSGGVCGACGRPFNEDYDKHDIEARLAAARADLEFVRKPLAAAVQASQALGRLAADYDRYVLDSNQHRAALAGHERSLEALGPQPRKFTAEDVERTRSRWNKLQVGRAAWIQWCVKRKELQNRFDSLQEDCQHLDLMGEMISEEAVQQITDDVVTRRKDVDRLAQYHSSVWHHANTTGAALWMAQERLQAAKAALEQAQCTLDKLRATEERATKLGALVRYLGDNRDRYLATLWDQLLGFSSEFVLEATSGKITEIKRTGDGSFSYVEEGQEMPVELASGYQGAVLGVAVKLALSAALGASGGVMLFDEVTADASDENALLLTGLLARTGNQVVLVSHRSADGSAADSVIELG